VLRRLGVVSSVVIFVFAASSRGAKADSGGGGPRAHARAGVSFPVGAPQSDDFGVGGAGALSGEYPLVGSSLLSAEANAGLILLSPVDSAKRSVGTISFLTLGARIHPFTSMSPGGLWIGGGAGLAFTGSNPRFGINTHVGWDIAIGESARFTIGPFVAYTHVVEPGSSAKLSDSDAHILWGGAQITFGAPKKIEAPPEPPPPPDADADGIPDKDDACPNQKGVRTHDENTNGCPARDQDNDGVPDDEDRCPNLAGRKRTDDPRMHGCPDVLPPPEPPPKEEEPPKKPDTGAIELD
jgi:hypothetical protein